MLARLAGKVRALVQRTVPAPEGGEQQAGGGVLLAQPLVLGRPGQDLLLPCLELRYGRLAIATATEWNRLRIIRGCRPPHPPTNIDACVSD